ncbi:MAG: glutamine--fructose-6-phosphate transaminase (isomerizing) [Candidatus Pacebacteria bacterium]|nr:glutamine--fructose-6-phosphate transaminase (isomerizing) [Candidatus Paceibacterota bacterium]
MCGIIGVISRNEQSVVSDILGGLGCLSSRGYDGAGIVVQQGASFHLHKREGKLVNLLNSLDENITGVCGIAHNRWATHGGATDTNAHPHMSSDDSVVVVHNGILENYLSLKAALLRNGFHFQSDTDTEVIPNLIQQALEDGAKSLVKAVMDIIPLLEGEYAFLVMSKKYPEEIVAATYERPLILGVSKDKYVVGSSEIALVGLSDKVVELGDNEVVSINANSVSCYKRTDSGWRKTDKKFRSISATDQDVSKGDFSTFLESEIFQQPETVKQALRGRMDESGELQISGLKPETLDFLKSASSITAVACGTSYHALLVAKMYFERYAKIRLDVELASEFQDREPSIDVDSFLIALSQSGETADTVRAVSYAKDHGAHVLAVTNCLSSQLVNKAHDAVSVQAGPEISVASTKAYTAQVITLFLLAIKAGVLNGAITSEKAKELFLALQELPEQIEQVLRLSSKVAEVAKEYRSVSRIIIIGKGYAVPVAYEAALKIQEVAYIDSYGFASGELKHGPLALVTEGVLVLAVALNGLVSERVVSNAEEVRARRGDIVALVTAGSEEEKLFANKAKYIFSLPKAMEEMTPILSVVIMQLMAFHLGIERGSDVDSPRNLAKSVTVS